MKRRRCGLGFMFDDYWLTSNECQEIVEQSWNSDFKPLRNKLANVSLALKIWSANEFGNLQKQLEEKMEKLQYLSNYRPTQSVCDEYRCTLKQIDEIMEKEEIYWRQRSRVHYLKEGDQNTNFFHMRASLRKRCNLIKGINGVNGEWVNDEDEIEKIAVDYFQNLYKTPNPADFDQALAQMEPSITASMNEELCQPVTREEVFFALSQMNLSKSLGIDGLNANFIKNIGTLLVMRWLILSLILLTVVSLLSRIMDCSYFESQVSY